MCWLQIRGAEPSEGNAANPGKIGESIANNINGPDPKGEASKVCSLALSMLSSCFEHSVCQVTGPDCQSVASQEYPFFSNKCSAGQIPNGCLRLR